MFFTDFMKKKTQITSAVSSISLRVDAHLCKLRDSPVARFYVCITLRSYMTNLICLHD